MSARLLRPADLPWALALVCSIHRRPFSAELLAQQFPAPHTLDTLADATKTLGLTCIRVRRKAGVLHREIFPLVAQLASPASDTEDALCVLLQADPHQVLVIEPGQAAPSAMPVAEFARRYRGKVWRLAPAVDALMPDEPDAPPQRRFGFHWFYAELRKHRSLWHEVLLASLVIQCIALATPLFTQTIIDKVVVHHTQSTLIVIAVGLALLMIFSAGLSWLRQYLVLHTGNRVDAALGAAVVARLFRLPPMYFQHRPTGVIAARLHGVETIREFVSSAAVTLVLDLPFLFIFVAIMFYYSVTLTLIVLVVLTLIISLSMLVAPLFQSRLQQQFALGARNQAFLTEYVSGLETVKSLQLEPQLNARYSGYLAGYLQANFATRQLGNTYNAAANLLEQLMGLTVLVVGAWTVMHSTEFTIGMLVAFQMFSGRLSQPMLRLVGLWQQFQQARLAIDRLGDLMNVPEEPYSTVPARQAQRVGRVQIEAIAFKYADHLPYVYRGLDLHLEPGSAVALMGPSGSGKSTLAKLLQGFYQPHEGRIQLDGVDIRHMSANELRSCFGVVPQETVLFSGTIYDNLQMASPGATFEQVTAACRMAEIHEAIEAMPQGYQSPIGERGVGLSGGQKQRIAIARALLKRPAILIFDEATSALDSATAEQFARTVNGLKGRVTMLFITHSLPRGLHFDAVFRLGPGGVQRVVEAMRAAPAPRSAGTS